MPPLLFTHIVSYCVPSFTLQNLRIVKHVLYFFNFLLVCKHVTISSVLHISKDLFHFLSLAVVEFAILTDIRQAKSKIRTINFRKASQRHLEVSLSGQQSPNQTFIW